VGDGLGRSRIFFLRADLSHRVKHTTLRSTEVAHVPVSMSDSEDSKTRLWVEKYRPKTVNDVSAQHEVRSPFLLLISSELQVTRALLGAIEQGQLPHLLFYGPPGTGKTSTILAVTRMLYHPSMLHDRVLELNASDERGIKLVRDKIKAFSQRSVCGTKYDGYPSPPFKIVILDEADTMTKDAQST